MADGVEGATAGEGDDCNSANRRVMVMANSVTASGPKA